MKTSPAQGAAGLPPNTAAQVENGIPPLLPPSCAGDPLPDPCTCCDAVRRIDGLLREWTRLGRGEGLHGRQLREALYPSLKQEINT